MTRTPLIILCLMAAVAAFTLYYFTPSFWQVDSQWQIITTTEISKPTIETYHQKWKTNLDKDQGAKFISETSCRLEASIWHCSYLVTNYRHLKRLLSAIDQGYRDISGWVDPAVIAQEQQKLNTQLEAKTAALQETQDRIQKEEQHSASQKTKIEALLKKQALYQTNIELRKQQLAIYQKLLPTMDASSPLYKVYQQKHDHAQKRIHTVESMRSKLDQRINKEFPRWQLLQDTKKEQTTQKQQILALKTMLDDHAKALQKIDRGKAPLPSEYAFTLKRSQINGVRNQTLLLSAFLTFFLIFSSIWHVCRRFFQHAPQPTQELTIVDTDETV